MDKEKNYISEYVEAEYEDIHERNIMNDQKKIFLGYGRGGEEEDFLVGTEEGLKNLTNACQAALEKGECIDYDLGEFTGIKLVKDSYYHEESETAGDWFLNDFIVPIIIFLLVSSLIVGFTTIVKWIF